MQNSKNVASKMMKKAKKYNWKEKPETQKLENEVVMLVFSISDKISHQKFSRYILGKVTKFPGAVTVIKEETYTTL